MPLFCGEDLNLGAFYKYFPLGRKSASPLLGNSGLGTGMKLFQESCGIDSRIAAGIEFRKRLIVEHIRYMLIR
jgi:hypothetical protein